MNTDTNPVPQLLEDAVMPRLSKIDNMTSNGLFSWILKDDRNADYTENNSAMIRVLVKKYNEIVDLLNEDKQLNKNQILLLRPEFKIGSGMTMIEWFEISEGGSFFCIKSGLRHADGETKSPYYYEDCVGGKNAEKIALDKFNIWWSLLNEA